MIWIIIILIAVIIIFKINDLIEMYKYNAKSSREKEISELQREHEHTEMINELNYLIGEKCNIKSEGLMYMSPDENEVTGTILNVDETFVELEFLRRKKKINLIYKIENIESVSKVIE